MKEVRVAMIGYGGIARAHAKGYAALAAENEPVKLVAVCDVDEKRFSNELKINIETDKSMLSEDVHIYTDVDELIKNEEYDMVDICLPTYLHKEYAIKFMELGKDVLCEKPMALSSSDCELMIKTAEKTGRKLMVGQCLRFDPNYLYLKECIDSGKFGKLRHLSMHRLSALPVWGFEHWFEKTEKSGGCILDMHIHDVDMARFLLGEPESVSVIALDDVVRWQYENTRLFYKDAFVTINGSWDEGGTFVFGVGFRARFEKASVVLEGSKLKVYPNEGDAFIPEIQSKSPYTEEIRFFTKMLLDDSINNVNNPPESAYKTVCLIEKMRESAAADGERIKI